MAPSAPSKESMESRRGRQLQETRQNPWAIEYSIHEAPALLKREAALTFPHNEIKEKDLLIVPCCQPVTVDLIAWGPKEQEEKDRCLEMFIAWGKRVCEAVRAQGHWADVTDPCSGLPLLSERGNHIYSDVEALELLLRYKTVDIGGCRVLSHPKWGYRVYPTTLFSTAPLAVLTAALETADASTPPPFPSPDAGAAPASVRHSCCA
eukprot:tig00020816_g14142.t1